MVYEAKVLTENNFKLYYGTYEGEFKSCFYNHTKSFRDRGNETAFKVHLATEGRIQKLQHTLEYIYVCNAL